MAPVGIYDTNPPKLPFTEKPNMWSISENDPELSFLASFLSGLECAPALASEPWAGSEVYIVLLFSFLPWGFLPLVKIHRSKLLYPQYNTWKKKLFINLRSP